MVTVTRVLPWRRRPRATVEETSTLLTEFRSRHVGADTTLIERAYEVALAAHAGQTRKSGEPYINHPMSVATIVARQGLDDTTVAAALLHDAVEDTPVSLDDLERDFGTEVRLIVDGVTKLDRLHFDTREEQQAASMRKMLVALSKDLRVLIIKLADRLHNMRTLAALPEHKQQRVAQETMDIYAPLANRLGMQEVKDQLQDLALVIVFGVLGWLMVKYDWPRPPMLLGLVLGRLAENRLFISTQIHGDFGWIDRPGVIIIGVIILVSLFFPSWQERRQRRRLRNADSHQPAPGAPIDGDF